MRKIVISSAIAAVMGASLVGVYMSQQQPEPIQKPVVSFENMGHLVALKMNYSDVIEHTEQRKQAIPLTGYDLILGSSRVLLVAKGDCSIATDLRQVQYSSSNPDTQQVTLRVPLPKPLSIRINHDAKAQGGSYLYTISNSGVEPLLADSSNQRDAIARVFFEAETKIGQACNQPSVIEQAKTNTSTVLLSMFQAVGWTAVIQWI